MCILILLMVYSENVLLFKKQIVHNPGMNQNNGKELEAKSLLAKEHEKLAETDFFKGGLI